MPIFVFVLATAVAIPNFDIEKICKSAGVVMNDKNATAGCVEDETNAKQRLLKKWPDFSAAARRECVGDRKFDIGTSYIELETCFQMQDWKTSK
jgi:hypothetical protein